MLLQLLKEAPRDLVTPPKRLSVARSPGTVCALFALVRAVHAGMLVHVLAPGLVSSPQALLSTLLLNLMFVVFVPLHWVTDSDMCIFAVGEGVLTGVPMEDTLLYGVLGPLFTAHRTKYRDAAWGLSAALLRDGRRPSRAPRTPPRRAKRERERERQRERGRTRVHRGGPFMAPMGQMATLSAVYSVWDAFCAQLETILPKRQKKIAALREQVRAEAAGGSKAPLERIMGELKGLETRVMQRDDSVYTELDGKPLFGTFRLGHYWNRFTPDTKQAIWQYMQSIFMLSAGLMQMSEKQLQQIESFATSCAEEMQAMKASGKQPNMRDVQAFMMKRMGTSSRTWTWGLMGGRGPAAGGGQQQEFDRAEFLKFTEQNKGLAPGVDLQSPEFSSMLDEEKMSLAGKQQGAARGAGDEGAQVRSTYGDA